MFSAETAPPWVADLLASFAGEVVARAPVRAVYVHGSLALGDFRDGSSDLDLVVVTGRGLTATEEDAVVALHRRLAARDARAAALHCLYADVGTLDRLGRRYPAWAHGRRLERALSAAARLELLQSGLVLHGPAVREVLAATAPRRLLEALREETVSFWAPASRRPSLWLRDEWVDIGLTSAARALAALEEGAVISKSEAIRRLAGRGLPPWLVEDVAARRLGSGRRRGLRFRLRRALVARAQMRRLLAAVAASGP